MSQTAANGSFLATCKDMGALELLGLRCFVFDLREAEAKMELEAQRSTGRNACRVRERNQEEQEEPLSDLWRRSGKV